MHQPVLMKECLDLLAIREGGCYVDGTVGSGGHAAAILERLGSGGFLLGIDRDEEAVERAGIRPRAWGGQCRIVHGNFGDIKDIAARECGRAVDGVLLDIGASSEQLDSAGRGFSFMSDGPLDMRMDRSRGRTAAELVAGISGDDLADLLHTFGEEPRARRIARAIEARRNTAPIATTGELARLVESASGGRRGRRHPATRTFQALRIAVNGEIDCLAKGLPGCLDVLVAGGRLAVISFHSIEDRIVKRFFARHVGKFVARAEGGSEWEGETPVVRLVNRKPVTPSEVEQEINPRARSAKLRVAERVAA